MQDRKIFFQGFISIVGQCQIVEFVSIKYVPAVVLLQSPNNIHAFLPGSTFLSTVLHALITLNCWLEMIQFLSSLHIYIIINLIKQKQTGETTLTVPVIISFRKSHIFRYYVHITQPETQMYLNINKGTSLTYLSVPRVVHGRFSIFYIHCKLFLIDCF